MSEVLLFSFDFARAKSEIESIGGAITHSFSNRAFVAQIPEDMGAEALTTAKTEMPEDLDDNLRLLIKAWQSKGRKLDESKMQQRENLKWDTPGFEPPAYDK